MALTLSGARVRSLVSARESKRGKLTGSVLTYNTLKPGSRLFQRLAWPRRIKHWSAGGRYGHMPHSLPLPLAQVPGQVGPRQGHGLARPDLGQAWAAHTLTWPGPNSNLARPQISPDLA